METKVVLECGCEFEYINNKPIWVYCDEHDVDTHRVATPPIKKYRRYFED